MGMYIPGEDVPEHCNQCILKDSWHNRCKKTGEYWDFTLKGRLPNCPIKEIKTPHGNLIDEDLLMEGINSEYDVASMLTNGHDADIIDMEYAHVEQEILETPIIIAAEE